ncbi:hypothetical protein LPJ81_005632, partial [Coemansia sp. IMI 209127]
MLSIVFFGVPFALLFILVFFAVTNASRRGEAPAHTRIVLAASAFVVAAAVAALAAIVLFAATVLIATAVFTEAVEPAAAPVLPEPTPVAAPAAAPVLPEPTPAAAPAADPFLLEPTPAAAPAAAPVLLEPTPAAAPAAAPVLPEPTPAAAPASAEPTNVAIPAEVVEAAEVMAKVAAALANIEPAASAAYLDIAEKLIAPAAAPVLPESAPAVVPASAEPTNAAIPAEVVEAAEVLVIIATALANIEPAASAAYLNIAEKLIAPATAPVLPESAPAVVPAFVESTDVPIEDEIFVRPTSSLFWMSEDEDYEPLANTPSLRPSATPGSLPSSYWDTTAKYAPWDR